MSKIFERIFRQISNYTKSFLQKYQCGFRKGYNTQHCLLFMLGKWKRTVDNGKVLGILLTDVDLESCWHPYCGTSKLTGNNQIDSMKAFIKTSCLYTINFTILLKHIFFQLSHVSKQYIHQSLRFYQFVHLIVSTSYSTKFLLFQFLPKRYGTWILKDCLTLVWFLFLLNPVNY